MEDYLAAIYRARQKGDRGSTGAIAARLGVSAASATAMFQKLASEGLVEYREYAGVSLTGRGERAALDVIRRHRLAERFLTEVLEIPWDRVDEMAHKMEHVLPKEVIEGFDRILGNPTTCPHGYPIPGPAGQIDELEVLPLAQLPVGAQAVVARVEEDDPELLRYLREQGLVPGTAVEVKEIRPFGDPITLRIGDGGADRIVGHRVAEAVYVSAASMLAPPGAAGARPAR